MRKDLYAQWKAQLGVFEKYAAELADVKRNAPFLEAFSPIPGMLLDALQNESAKMQAASAKFGKALAKYESKTTPEGIRALGDEYATFARVCDVALRLHQLYEQECQHLSMLHPTLARLLVKADTAETTKKKA